MPPQAAVAARLNVFCTATAQPVGARTPGWQQRLEALVRQRMHVPFAWYANDCAAWVCDAVQAQHERDTLAPLRVPRANRNQAAQQVLALRGTAALERCGLQRIAPAMAQVGDVVLLWPERRARLLALCNGADALAPGADGLVVVPLATASRAWRV